MNVPDLETGLADAWALRERGFEPRVHLFVPSVKRYETSEYSCASAWDFVPVSVTADRCQLRCDHCQGELLRTMKPARTPRTLWARARKLASEGGTGILLSGGSDRQGRVPLTPYLETVARIREQLGLKVVVHTGLVDGPLARGLARAGVECAMMDVMGDADTIRSVYHLDLTPESLADSLKMLHREGVRTVPHVVVGLDRGRIRGERKALEIIAGCQPSAVVLVVLNPLTKTPMQGVDPPPPDDVAGLMVHARKLMPVTPLCLGCARPGGRYRKATDQWALKAGFNGIAFPADGTATRAREMGLETEFARECCSLVIDRI